MVPSQDTTHALIAFAAVIKALLQDSNTPKIIRDKLARFAAELRDELTENIARMVDGAEAEVVILASAGLSHQTPPDERTSQSLPLSHQTPPAPESRPGGSE